MSRHIRFVVATLPVMVAIECGKNVLVPVYCAPDDHAARATLLGPVVMLATEVEPPIE
jgi:hypothetical protein